MSFSRVPVLQVHTPRSPGTWQLFSKKLTPGTWTSQKHPVKHFCLQLRQLQAEKNGANHGGNMAAATSTHRVARAEKLVETSAGALARRIAKDKFFIIRVSKCSLGKKYWLRTECAYMRITLQAFTLQPHRHLHRLSHCHRLRHHRHSRSWHRRPAPKPTVQPDDVAAACQRARSRALHCHELTLRLRDGLKSIAVTAGRFSITYACTWCARVGRSHRAETQDSRSPAPGQRTKIDQTADAMVSARACASTTCK